MAEHDKPLAPISQSAQGKHVNVLRGMKEAPVHSTCTKFTRCATSKTNSWTGVHRPTFKRCSDEAPCALNQLIAVVILPRRQQIPYHCSVEDGSRLEAQELRV